MATLNLGRVRIVFKGDFSDLDGQTLEFYDGVTFAGSLYVLKVNSLVVDDSDTGNRPPTTIGQASFTKVADGLDFAGEWEGDTGGDSARIYYKNQIVRFGPNSFIALQEVPIGRSDPNTEALYDTGYWEPLAKGFGNYLLNYDGSQSADPGDLLNWQGSLYLAIGNALSGQTPTTNPELFDKIDGRLNFTGPWDEQSSYDFSDVAVFHGSAYVCVAQTTNQPIDIETGDVNQDWELLSEGLYWNGAYDPQKTDGYYRGDIITYGSGIYLAVQKAQIGQNPGNSPGIWVPFVTGGALLETNFVADGFLVKSQGEFTVDTNTYLQENETITITGHGSGSGKTSIPLSLTVQSIIDQTQATIQEGGDTNTRLFGAVDIGGGNFELRKVDPETLRPNVVTDFTGTQGIQRLSAETGPDVTLELNVNAISTLTVMSETNNVANVSPGDQFMIRDYDAGVLKALSYQQLLEKLNTQVVGNQVDGVTTFKALLDTPTDYTGYNNAYVRVNDAGNALEFGEDDILVKVLIYG